MYLLFKTLAIVALIATIYGQPVVKKKIKQMRHNHLPCTLVTHIEGAANEEQENQSAILAEPQNCLRDDEAGVCVPYYLCKTPTTDSDDNYSDEYEKQVVFKGEFPEFCSSYLETCCTPVNRLEKSEVLKEKDLNVIF
ncbi:hypothetical protein O0L34_g17473 [Tuta absoluta]|nr:hypothetical protein O0L34_g17473 [Tuta absoluta]